jgi:hypothetical protein
MAHKDVRLWKRVMTVPRHTGTLVRLLMATIRITRTRLETKR